VAYVSCVFCCEVCADYEPAEGQLLISQTNDTVLLRCSQDTAKTWTLNCVNGQWITNDDQRPHCRSVTTSAGSGLNSSTDLDTKGSVANNTFQKYSQYQYIYFMKKVLAIPIPINELQKYAILSAILSAILFW